MLQVDIIICVHNALDSTRKCLDSILDKTDMDYNLVIVNDGSNLQTSSFLDKFSRNHSNCRLIENPIPYRYTKAANQGLMASEADYVILLNSDTIVSKHWLSKIIEYGESDEKTGILSPLSNAAGWQSVPIVHDHNGDWYINQLPKKFTVDQMAELVENLSQRYFPKVTIANGFCFAIKRRVLDRIGYFDEYNFPLGYAEEMDYCFRASRAGFGITILDNTYIYHEKSRSYGRTWRGRLSKMGRQRMVAKFGTTEIEQAIFRMKNEPTLLKIRTALSRELEQHGP